MSTAEFLSHLRERDVRLWVEDGRLKVDAPPGVVDAALVLTIDPTYFRLTGGIERWLYRLVRKHGGRQEHGWQFDFQHLYRKSGSVARFYDFAADLRTLVARQSLPGYVLGIERMPGEKTELLTFRPVPPTARG